jgi:hypothetical protein
MSKRIDQLTPATDSQVLMPSWMWCVGDPTTGQLYNVTSLQLKTLFAPLPLKYVATGSEGTTLTISTLLGKSIQSIAREGQTIYQVSSSPDSTEFTWNGTSLTLGLSVNPGERFLIIYTS